MPTSTQPVAPVPLTESPLWLYTDEGFVAAREHEVESILTIGNGYLGTRGSVEELSSASEPGTFLAGIYYLPPGDSSPCHLTIVPDWLDLVVSVEGELVGVESGKILSHRRTLDVRQGMMVREWQHEDPQGRITSVRTVRFASLADPHALGQEVWIQAENYTGEVRIAFGLNARSAPLRQEASLAVVEQFSSPESHIGMVSKTQGTDLLVAMASHTEGAVVDGAAAQTLETCTVEQTEDRIRQVWRWRATPQAAVRLHRLVTIYTSRDLESHTHHHNTDRFYRDALAKATQAESEQFSEALGRPPLAETTQQQIIAEATRQHLRHVSSQGFGPFFEQHRQAWSHRWEQCNITIEGDSDADHWVRFALYHLNITGAPWNEKVSLGARALSGVSYEGHVFWDTEIFMLPFFIYTWPPAARAQLLYRYHTLEQAMKNAREGNYRGAYFAWESAISGEEQTPLFARRPDGEIIPILSGIMEDHIVADIAYAVWHYWHATHDTYFMGRYGGRLLMECARFWASRVTPPDAEGRLHIERVVGPDEYHEDVNDNAFTNVMARWNLLAGKQAAQWLRKNASEHWEHWVEDSVARYDLTPEELAAEIEEWGEMAHRLEENFHPEHLLFEQHEGFFDLDSVNIAEYVDAMVPMDVVLGPQKVRKSQVIKQADVVMLFILLGSQYDPTLWASNFYFYEPRTAHGSSLSPAMHALMAARLNDLRLAMKYFREAATIDLSNNMGNASGGVHLAGMGGLWQAVVFGFAGLQIIHSDTMLSLAPGVIALDPHLPPEWKGLAFPLIYQGKRLEFHIRQGRTPQEAIFLEVTCQGSEPVNIQLKGGRTCCLTPGVTFQVARYRTGGWTPWQPVPQMERNSKREGGRVDSDER